MKSAIEQIGRHTAQLTATAFVAGVLVVATQPVHAADASAASRWGNPCDTRDTCTSTSTVYKVVRVGRGEEIRIVKKADDVQVANQRVQK